MDPRWLRGAHTTRGYGNPGLSSTHTLDLHDPLGGRRSLLIPAANDTAPTAAVISPATEVMIAGTSELPDPAVTALWSIRRTVSVTVLQVNGVQAVLAPEPGECCVRLGPSGTDHDDGMAQDR